MFHIYLGLMRLATVMMSLRLAGAFTFAPDPIVMATSFSVRVWHICTKAINIWMNQSVESHFKSKILCDYCRVQSFEKSINYLQDGDTMRHQTTGNRERQTDNQRCDEETADKSEIMLISCIIIIMTAEKDMAERPYEASSIHSSFSRMASMCGFVITTSSSSNSDGSLWVSIAPIRSTVGLRGKNQ